MTAGLVLGGLAAGAGLMSQMQQRRAQQAEANNAAQQQQQQSSLAMMQQNNDRQKMAQDKQLADDEKARQKAKADAMLGPAGQVTPGTMATIATSPLGDPSTATTGRSRLLGN